MDEHGIPVNTQAQVRDTQEKEAGTEHLIECSLLIHRDAVRVYRNAARKAEAHLEVKTWPKIPSTGSKYISCK